MTPAEQAKVWLVGTEKAQSDWPLWMTLDGRFWCSSNGDYYEVIYEPAAKEQEGRE